MKDKITEEDVHILKEKDVEFLLEQVRRNPLFHKKFEYYSVAQFNDMRKLTQQKTRDDFIKKIKPLLILLDRIDKGEYFIEDDKELGWRECLKDLKKLEELKT